MSIKQRLSEYFLQIVKTVKRNPMEIIIGIMTFVLFQIRDNEAIYAIFPILLCTSYILNGMCERGKKRFFYYLSLLLIFFLFTVEKSFCNTYGFYILLLSSIALLLTYPLKKENALFTINTINSILCAIAAVTTSLLVFLIGSGIYGSINVIFLSKIFLDDSPFYGYLAGMLYCVVAPLLFFAFVKNNEAHREMPFSGFIHMISRYLLTPALILYTAILYLYFLKIVFLWELPKGGIVIMSLMYILLGIITQAIRSLRPNDGFFYRFTLSFHYVVLPAVVMMWIASIYRVNEYDYTQERVYLMVANAAVTLSLAMLMYKKSAHYRNIILLFIFVFLLFTYVPGISAHSIGLDSQKSSIVKLAKQIYTVDQQGNVIVAEPEDTPQIKSIAKKQERLESAIRYCRNNLKEQDTTAFNTFIQEQTGVSVRYMLGNLVKERWYLEKRLYRPRTPLSLEGFRNLYFCSLKLISDKPVAQPEALEYTHEGSHSVVGSPIAQPETFEYTLYLNEQDYVDYLEIIRPDASPLQLSGIELSNKLIQQEKPVFQLDTLDMRIIFNYIHYNDVSLQIQHIVPEWILVK